MKKKTGFIKKKIKLFSFLCLILLVLFVNLGPIFAGTIGSSTDYYKEERQFMRKIEIIHEAFPNQTDEAALYATVAHRGTSTGYVKQSYDPDFDENAYKTTIGNFKSDVNSVFGNPLQYIDVPALIELFLNAVGAALSCGIEAIMGTDENGNEVQTGIDTSNADVPCMVRKLLEPYFNKLNHTSEKNVETSVTQPRSIDLLIAATIIMLDSSHWTGTYSDENYMKALAGDGLVGNMFDGSDLFQAVAATVFNGVICGAYFIADIGTGGNFANIALTQFNPSMTFTEDDSFGLEGASPADQLSRYYTMANICSYGFLGGTYDYLRNYTLETDEQKERYQAKKDQIAEEIIQLADYYRRISKYNSSGGNGSCSGGGGVCSYKIPGVDGEVSNIKVQTIQSEYGNVSGKAGDDIPGEGLIDFEDDYIPGVVYAEFGGADSETRKAQAVASRSYALTRGTAMNGALNIGLSIEAGQWVLRIRTSTSDQVYCDVKQGCSTLNGSMQGTIHGAYTVYAGAVNGSLTRQPLSDQTLLDDVAATRGQVAVDGSGFVVNTGFVSSDQRAWQSAIGSGKDYKQAIIDHYSSRGVVDVTSTCDNSCGSSGIYSNDELEEYYQLSKAAVKTNTSVSADMAGTEYGSLDGFNAHIKKTINNAGYGTRQGVVAAGVSLIGDYIKATGKRIRYNQNAGFCPGITTGRQSAETEGVVDNLYLDCSGFAWWTLYNAGFKIPCYPETSGIYSWARNAGYITDSRAGKAGDFAVTKGKGHVMLIVGTYDGGYYVAEETGCSEGGEINKRSYDSLSNYAIINMDEYYNNPSNLR